MPRQTYLVTGCTGFIGGAIAAALVDAGHEVHGTSRAGTAGPAGVTMHACDLLDDAAVETMLEVVRPTHLVHAAWDVTHNVYWTSPANLAWLAASVRLVDAFRRAEGQRAVGVGTCAEYAVTPSPCHEATSRLDPATPYGRCKYALFEAFQAAAQLGLSTAWGRLFFPYGTGDGERRFLPSLRRALAAGNPFDMSPGTQLLDFIHISDVGAAFAQLAGGTVQGAVNIASGEGVALRDIALCAAEALGRDRSVLRFGALPMRATDPIALVADVARLRDEVGFRPRVGWRDGIGAFARNVEPQVSR